MRILRLTSVHTQPAVAGASKPEPKTEPILVNMSLVRQVTTLQNGRSRLFFDMDHGLTVTETIDEIEAMLL